MRVLRLAIVSATLVIGLAAPVAAQTTTTTIPPVRSIPVTSGPTTTAAPSPTTTTTVASTAVTSATTDAKPLASTGVAADKLVPLGFLLIALGAALTGAARRPRRTAYSFL